MPEQPPLEVRVWGERACFTRPEFKAERVSYPVLTPAAARGILEAIFWKPPFAWRVREVWVLRPLGHFSLVRNEVKTVASVLAARKRGGHFADKNRAQRHTLGLRDVAYRIRADVVLRPGVTGGTAGFRDQFRRRVERGRCFQRPYLGCREFAADFGPVRATEPAIEVNEDLGRMHFDLAYAGGTGLATPLFFEARLERGVLRVPPALYERR